MANSNTSVGVPYLITSRNFPTDPVEQAPALNKAYIETAQAVNKRTIGTYNTFQIVTGDLYYSNANNSPSKPIQFRQGYRQLFPFAAIAAGATFTISHGITGITELVHFYGDCVTDASVIVTAKYEPIPFVSATDVTQQIELFMNDSVITIINGAGNNNIISGTIILEYLLN